MERTRSLRPQLTVNLSRGFPLSHVGTLATLPLVLVFFHPFWAYTSSQTTFIDPWLYPSYFLHFKSQLLAFPAAYYGDRLSAIIPGWIYYHLFGAWWGSYLFKLTVIYTSVGALYLVISRLSDGRVALLTAVLFEVQPYFLMAFGWDYVNGIGIAYCSLGFLFALHATTTDNYRRALALAGVFTTALITTHFLWLNLAWTIPLAYLLFNRSARRHPLVPSLMAFFSGALLLAVLFGFIYHSLTHRWLFLGNSLRHTLTGLAPAQKVNRPVGSWIGEADWLIHFTALSPLAAICAWRFRRKPDRFIPLVLFLLSFVTIWMWQYVGFPFVMIKDYTSFLFPVYAIALGAVIADPVGHLRARTYWFLIACVLIAGGITLFSASRLDLLDERVIHWVGTHARMTRLWNYRAFVICTIAVIATVPLLRPPARAYAVPILSAGIMLMAALQVMVQQKQGWFSPTQDYTNKEGFRLVLRSDAWTDERVPDRRVLVWYNIDEPQSGILTGVASQFLWGWSLLNTALPNVGSDELKKLREQPKLLLFSFQPEKLLQARQAVEKAGFPVREWQETNFQEGKLNLHLAFLELGAQRHFIEKESLEKGLVEAAVVSDMAAIQPTSPLTVLHRLTGLRLLTPAGQWSYAAYMPLGGLLRTSDEYWLKISARVLTGEAAFGVLNARETDFVDRQILSASEETQELVLDISQPAESRKLIIENATPGGARAELVISRIAAMVRRNQ